MRADDAPDNRSRCKSQPERRDGTSFCKVADQAGDRVYPNEERRDSSSLSNVRPSTEQQQRCEKYSATGPGKPCQKSEACPDAYRHRL